MWVTGADAGHLVARAVVVAGAAHPPRAHRLALRPVVARHAVTVARVHHLYRPCGQRLQGHNSNIVMIMIIMGT